MSRWQRLVITATAVGNQWRPDILDAIMIGRKYRWAHYRIYRKPVLIQMCGNTLMAAVTLHRQQAPLGQSCLWNSCHISWVNTHRSIRKHLPNNSSASIRHQQQRKQRPSAGAQSPGWAQEQQQFNANKAQRGSNESSRLAFGGARVGGVGFSGVRGHPPKLLWAKKTPGTSAVMTVQPGPVDVASF